MSIQALYAGSHCSTPIMMLKARALSITGGACPYSNIQVYRLRYPTIKLVSSPAARLVITIELINRDYNIL